MNRISKAVFIYFFFLGQYCSAQIIFTDNDSAVYKGKLSAYDDKFTTNNFLIKGFIGPVSISYQPRLLIQPADWGMITICDCETCDQYNPSTKIINIAHAETDKCLYKVGFQPKSIGAAILKITSNLKGDAYESFYICEVTETGTRILVNDKKFFCLFPNPLVGNSFNFISGSKTGDFNIKVVAIDAKMLYQQLVHVDDYQASVVLPVLDAGLYSILITDTQTGEVYINKLQIP